MITHWTPEDAIQLRSFLAKCPNFKKAIEAAKPKCTGETMEASALSGRERQGWDNELNFITDQLGGDQLAPGQDKTTFIPD